MKLIFYQNFFYVYFDDLLLSEEVFFGKVFLFEEQYYFVEEVMNCDLIVIWKFKEMFIYGVDGVFRNFDVVKCYWYVFYSYVEVICCMFKILFSLDDYV